MTARGAPIRVGGWAVYAHPVFLGQLDALAAAVEARRKRDPEGWRRSNPAKRLAAILRLVTEIVPADPGAARFRQGDALGPRRRHWFRAKFLQRYRLFFRYDETARIIVFAWVNDTESLRARDSRTDVYAVFQRMLERGRPPDDFDSLLAEAEAAAERLRRLAAQERPPDAP